MGLTMETQIKHEANASKRLDEFNRKHVAQIFKDLSNTQHQEQ